MRRRGVLEVSGDRYAFNGKSTATVALVVEDGGRALFTVRPKRTRRVFELPLSDVAQIVVERILRAEARARVAEKKRGRA